MSEPPPPSTGPGSSRGHWIAVWIPAAALVLAAVIGAGGAYLASSRNGETGGAARGLSESPRPGLRCESVKKLRGEILRPASGAKLPRTYTIEGTVCNLPSGRHVWTAVETSAGLSAKPPEVSLDSEGRFAVNVRDMAEIPEGFSVVLLVVGPRGQAAIQRWLAEGKRTESYPPLQPGQIPGSRRLAVNAGLSFSA